MALQVSCTARDIFSYSVVRKRSLTRSTPMTRELTLRHLHDHDTSNEMELIHGVLHTAVDECDDMAHLGSALINLQGIAQGLPVRVGDILLCVCRTNRYHSLTDDTACTILIRFSATSFANPRKSSYSATAHWTMNVRHESLVLMCGRSDLPCPRVRELLCRTVSRHP